MTGRFAPVPLLLGRRETAEDESEKDAMFTIGSRMLAERLTGSEIKEIRVLLALEVASTLEAALGRQWRGIMHGTERRVLFTVSWSGLPPTRDL